MEQSELMVLLSFLGLIALIVYLVKRDVSGRSPDVPPPPAADPASKPPAPTPTPRPSGAVLPQKEQKYVSIYEYTSMKPVKKCAHCDGENNNDAKVCCICGNDIDS